MAANSIAVGVDVGGTKCLAVAVDAAGTIIRTERQPTPVGAPALVVTVAGLARRMADTDGPDGSDVEVTFGVGVPGSITREGVITSSPHLPGIVHFDAAAALSAELGQQVRVANDATCATLAEWKTGAGRGERDLVLVTLGTGIGGGVVADGHLMLGAHGYVGEFGHMLVDPDGPNCPCGQRGCWERYASGSAIGEEARRRAARGELVGLLSAAGSVAAITSELVVDFARAGDPGAQSVVAHFSRWVAIGLANLTNAFDPSCFVLGGGLVGAADLFGPILEAELAHALYAANVRPRPVLRFAELGEHAGAVGAALYSTPNATA